VNAIADQFSAMLWSIFNRPRLIDLIDILLLTVILYELLLHVRHTRLSQTFKGIAVLILATWLSDMLGMRTIHALLSWAINAGPVLLIVLFQPEIRRVLEELGNTSVREVSTGVVSGNLTQITDGLREGEQVVFSLSEFSSDGQLRMGGMMGAGGPPPGNGGGRRQSGGGDE